MVVSGLQPSDVFGVPTQALPLRGAAWAVMLSRRWRSALRRPGENGPGGRGGECTLGALRLRLLADRGASLRMTSSIGIGFSWSVAIGSVVDFVGLLCGRIRGIDGFFLGFLGGDQLGGRSEELLEVGFALGVRFLICRVCERGERGGIGGQLNERAFLRGERCRRRGFGGREAGGDEVRSAGGRDARHAVFTPPVRKRGVRMGHPSSGGYVSHPSRVWMGRPALSIPIRALISGTKGDRSW